MNENALYRYMDGIIDRSRIGAEDASCLQCEIFPAGLTSRDEADILIALDRAIADKDPAWDEALIRLVVDYVVWTSRPTGAVDGETARWLVTSLSCGNGPTDCAVRIGVEIVKEAERVEETLVRFLLQAKRQREGGQGAYAGIVRGLLAA